MTSAPDLGQADFSLSGQSPSGAHYRLRHADLTISGPTTRVLHTDDPSYDPDATALSTNLSAGTYDLSLADGWYLERVAADGTATRVDATRTSPDHLPFAIAADMHTAVTLRFQTSGEPVSMGNGDADIGIAVDDGSSSQAIVPSIDGQILLLEQSSADLRVHLAKRPAAEVTVSIHTSNAGVVTASPSELTFTPDNFDHDMHVQLVAVHDANATSDAATISMTANLAGVDAVPLRVIVQDLDQQAILVGAPITIDEGMTGTVSVQLAAQPVGDVTVSVQSADPRVAVTSPPVTFRPDNWQLAHIVTLAAVKDDDTVDSDIPVTFTSLGLDARTLSVHVHDLDVLGLNVTTLVALAEGSQTWLNVSLTADPGTSIALAATSDAPAVVSVSPSTSTVTFDSSNWNQPHWIVLDAPADADHADNTATVTLHVLTPGTSLVDHDVTVHVSDHD